MLVNRIIRNRGDFQQRRQPARLSNPRHNRASLPGILFAYQRARGGASVNLSDKLTVEQWPIDRSSDGARWIACRPST